MRFAHRDHTHDVYLCDDGTLDTVIEIDGHIIRYSEADRHPDGRVKPRWFKDAAIEACDDGPLMRITRDTLNRDGWICPTCGYELERGGSPNEPERATCRNADCPSEVLVIKEG